MKTYAELRTEGGKALQDKWDESALAFLPAFATFVILIGLYILSQSAMGGVATNTRLGHEAIEVLFCIFIILLTVPFYFGFVQAMWKKIKGENGIAIKDTWAGAKQHYDFSIGYALAVSGVEFVATILLTIVYLVSLPILALVLDLNALPPELMDAIKSQGVPMILLFTSVGKPLRVMLLSVLVFSLATIIIYVWVKYMYGMAIFIRIENPTIGVMDAMKASRKMMYGHKWQYFVLSLTFMGWIILAILSCGIGFLWLVPYMTATKAAFYEEIKPKPIIEETIIIEDITNE